MIRSLLMFQRVGMESTMYWPPVLLLTIEFDKWHWDPWIHEPVDSWLNSSQFCGVFLPFTCTVKFCQRRDLERIKGRVDLHF